MENSIKAVASEATTTAADIDNCTVNYEFLLSGSLRDHIRERLNLSKRAAQADITEAKAQLGFGRVLKPEESIEVYQYIESKVSNKNDDSNVSTASGTDSTRHSSEIGTADGMSARKIPERETKSAPTQNGDATGKADGKAVEKVKPALKIVGDNDNHPLKLSEGATVKSGDLFDLNTTWYELKQRLASPEIGTKDGLYFVRGYCENDHRTNETLTDTSLCIIDGDGRIDIETGEIISGAPDINLVKAFLDKQGWEYALYTSYSHNLPNKGSRYRIVLPLSETVKTADIDAITNYVFHILNDAGIYIDYSKESAVPAQPWYFPRCSEDRINDFRFFEGPGQLFDVQTAKDWQAEQPVDETIRSAPAMTPAIVDPKTPIGFFNTTHPISELLFSHGYKFISKTSVNGEVISRYLSPHSTTNQAGVIHFSESNRVFSHGTSDPLANVHAHDAFSVEAVLSHDGDQSVLLELVMPDFQQFQKELKVYELKLQIDNLFSGLPVEKIDEIEKVIGQSDAAYSMNRKVQAKTLGIGVTSLDKLRKDWLKLTTEKQATETAEVVTIDQAPGTIAASVIKVVKDVATLFHDSEETCYAHISIKGHEETYKIKSESFKKFINHVAYKTLNTVLDSSGVKTVMEGLSAGALFDGECHEVNIRVAKKGDNYYLDMCDQDWRVIEIIPGVGYQIITESPVYFIRTKTMKPLPEPEQGNLNTLWKFVPITDKEDQIRWVTNILDALRPDTVYPIGAHSGPEGSGKTSTLKLAKSIIDPSGLESRSTPGSVRDFVVGAVNSHIMAFENMSTLSNALSDAICRTATGSGSAERTLYDNLEETIAVYKKPVFFEGISFVMQNADIIDRAVHFDIPKLDIHISETRYKADLAKVRGQILGAILDLFSDALAIVDDVEIAADVRLVDFARLGQAVYQVRNIEGDFSVHLDAHQKHLRFRAMEGSPVIGKLLQWLAKRTDSEGKPVYEWEGAPGELLDNLRLGNKWSSQYPQSGKGMAEKLKRFQKTLACMNVHLEELHIHTSAGNLYRITWDASLLCSGPVWFNDLTKN